MNLIEKFLAAAERRGDRAAIVAGNGAATSFAELALRSAQFAAAWRNQGIVPGDRVVLAMALHADLYASIAALWRLGAVVVFPEPALGLRGLRHAIAATAPKAFLSAGKFRLLKYLLPELARVPLRLHPAPGGTPLGDIHAAGPDHPALISFTSGSTGRAKGIVRSQGFLAAQDLYVGQLIRPRDGADAIDLVAFPVFVIVNLGLGVTSVLPNWRLTRQDSVAAADLARLIQERGITRLLVPPSICERIAGGAALPGITQIFTGGGPVFPDILERLAPLLPHADVVSVYGSTEAEPIAHQSMAETRPADWNAMRNGAGLLAGRPIPEVKVKLIDDEIVVTGDHVNKGYLDAADDAANKIRLEGEIWHRTGDAGRFDESGRLWLLGRRDARAGGHYPFSIEVAARFWPGVKRVALVPGAETGILAIEGDGSHQAEWIKLAGQQGNLRVVPLDRIPLDRRHRSKVDYVALKALVK